jgi:hypothetical protein
MPLRFVSRAQWGARPPKSVTRRPPSALAGVAVHWFGEPGAAGSHEGCAALLRSVQRTHMAPGGLGAKNGGADIAYNHAVCPHGSAFTLRGFGVQTGANGDNESNRAYAAVVYMAGTGNRVTKEALPVLAEVIRMWQAKGAGPLVKPHHFFTGSTCPGPDLLKWVDLKPHPWAKGGSSARVPLKDETPEWLIDFIFWRLAQGAEPKARPKGIPKRIPESAWEAAARMHRMATLMGPQEAFLDWVEWRRAGAKKDARPRSVPKEIPKAWQQERKRLERIFKAPPAGAAPKGREAPAPKGAKAAPVTTSIKLLTPPPHATQQALERYMLSRRHGKYSDDDVRAIIKRYVTTSQAAGIDPLLVISQMVLETGNLTSRWSQRPRRNPAGIGVTGKPGVGISFPSWDAAVRAHVGRLLAYAIPKGKANAVQRALIEEALEVRPLPDSRRGCAPTLAGLAGTWAADKKYADKIARLANQIRAA